MEDLARVHRGAHRQGIAGNPWRGEVEERGGGGEDEARAASHSPLEAACPTPAPCSDFCTVQYPAPGLRALLGIRCPEALHGILSIM